jgi:mannose-6-phosphate isomerase-like protein (cupin superfamily)
MPNIASPKEVAQSLSELWSPRIVGELDESFVKVAKVHGTFGWHNHEHEDELFFILKGSLRIDMEAGAAVLNEGDMFVVPKGVQHNPIAEQECLIMLIERKSTQHAGNTVNQYTRSLEEQLRPA